MKEAHRINFLGESKVEIAQSRKDRKEQCPREVIKRSGVIYQKELERL